jgi:hypothetical protein
MSQIDNEIEYDYSHVYEVVDMPRLKNIILMRTSSVDTLLAANKIIRYSYRSFIPHTLIPISSKIELPFLPEGKLCIYVLGMYYSPLVIKGWLLGGHKVIMMNNKEPVDYPIEEYHKLACSNFVMDIVDGVFLSSSVNKYLDK